MENENQKSNWIPIVIATLLVAGVLGGYYLHILSEKNKILRKGIEDKLELEKNKLQQQKYIEEEKRNYEQTKETTKNILIEACESAAYSDYYEQWDARCKALSDRRSLDINNCINLLHNSNVSNVLAVEMCKQTNPPRAKKDCTLPKLMADEFNERLQRNEDNCYKKYK